MLERLRLAPTELHKLQKQPLGLRCLLKLHLLAVRPFDLTGFWFANNGQQQNIRTNLLQQSHYPPHILFKEK